jgi:uncharacterized coiled-coil protein SlyX
VKAGRIAAVLGVTVLVATGLYFFVYLWRWEWNRALIAGVLFVATETAMATASVLGRLRRIDDRLAAVDPRVLGRLRESAPPPHDHFEWLSPKSGRMGVFVPVLIGMGVVASGLAWLVERLARATAGPVLERGLAGRLAPLAWPADGLLPPVDDPAALLAGPGTDSRRR